MVAGRGAISDAEQQLPREGLPRDYLEMVNNRPTPDPVPQDGAARIDEWTAKRRSDPESARLIDEWLEVVDCDAGLYEDLGLEQL